MRLTDLNPHWVVLVEDTDIRAQHATGCIWDLLGQDDFETLTLTPSIDASASGHWHGFITNGEASP